MRHDFLVVGAGLFGSTFAQRCKEKGKTCLVIDKRDHVAGNCYTKKIEGIDVHCFGPHSFNTNSEDIWEYVRQFTKITQYVHRVKVNYRGKIYSMPINLQTMYEMYGVSTPLEAERKLTEVRVPISDPRNLEEWCLSQVGPQLYETFIKYYTKKQWKKDPRELPASIIKRLPLRFSFDDRWHQSVHSGIPSDGYTQMVVNMLDGVKVELGVDFFNIDWKKYAKKVIYSGKIDQLFSYCYGQLDYRTLRFETKVLDGDYQGVAQVNYTDEETPYTRTTEHKHFTYKQSDRTVVTWEYPEDWRDGAEPYYPVNDERNNDLYKKYKSLVDDNYYVVGGRLGKYIYQDMDATVGSALKISKQEL